MVNAFGLYKCGKTVMGQIKDKLYLGESLCALLLLYYILELENVLLCVLCIART